MPLPFPQIILPDVTQISPELLRQHGIRGLLLDIDGTLMQTRDAMPAQPVLDWLQRMKAEGFVLYILSNNKHEGRVRAFRWASPGSIWPESPGRPALPGPSGRRGLPLPSWRWWATRSLRICGVPGGRAVWR